MIDQLEQGLGVAERRNHQAEQARMGLGQGFQQRRGMLPGQLQVADQHLHRFGVQPYQRLGQVARAQQAMPAGMAEGTDAVQGFRVVVEQQHAQRRRQRGRGRCRQALAAGDRSLKC